MIYHSTLAADTLMRSHSIDVYAIAYSPTFGMVARLPVTSGQVVCDSRSQVRRTASVSIGDDALWPATPSDVLSPLGSEMSIHYGVLLPDGRTEWIPLIRGPITDVQHSIPVGNNSEGISVNISDRSLLVAQARLTAPTQTVAGATTVAEITRLIKEVVSDAGVRDLTDATKIAPQLEIERERWSDGVEKLADSISAEVFCDPYGAFIIRPEPSVTDTPVWTVSDDEASVVVTDNEEYTRDLVYNRVVASGQRTDGTPPVYAVADDTNPKSPTYINGPFGIKTRFYASPLLTTVAQCQSAATSLLARVTGKHLKVELTNITHPALEAGDVIRVKVAGTNQVHIVDSVTTPLDPKSPQQIVTRSPALPEETVV